MRLRHALAPLLLSLSLSLLTGADTLAAPVVINAEGQKLIDSGHALSGQGKPEEAMQAFAAAARADPASSLPFSSSAALLYDLSFNSSAEKRAALRAQAVTYAGQALARNNADPVAQELLRMASEDAAPPIHTPNGAANQLINRAEALFSQKRFDQALPLYEQAAAADPSSAQPWIYAGDCFYAQGHWQEAESRFRKATVIEPLFGQAWRFLADALVEQGKTTEAQGALFGGIAAQPSQLPTWAKLASIMNHAGTPLKRLDFRMQPSVSRDTAGQSTIHIDPAAMKQGDTADGAFWVAYGLALAQNPGGFKGDYAALQGAMQIQLDLAAKGTVRPFADPALARLRELAAGGRLEAAMLLLMYRESYRPAFEAWKSAHPDGVREFVIATGLRP